LKSAVHFDELGVQASETVLQFVSGDVFARENFDCQIEFQFDAVC
jgi:hypothetical protein